MSLSAHHNGPVDIDDRDQGHDSNGYIEGHKPGASTCVFSVSPGSTRSQIHGTLA